MFEFRLNSLIKALLLLACILGGCDYLSTLDKLKAELADLNARNAVARETLELRRQEWTELKAAKDKLDQLLKHEQDLIRQRELLDTQDRRLTADVKYLADSMTVLVEKVRTSAIGAVIPELKLANRPPLHQAKIFKITDDSISFLHEEGAANLKVLPEELPPELVQKYDLGPKSISLRLRNLLKELPVK
ncbi:hypothetical protein [Prosthecobacter sp.]|uniref:hypothetical protein n=1 Tax=Prosthecobacter sp. TaxID=1965333 RepID=UPI00378322A0